MLQALFKNRLTTKLTDSFKSMSRAAGNIQTGRLHAFACINIASATLPRSWVNRVGCMEVLLGPSTCPAAAAPKLLAKSKPAQARHCFPKVYSKYVARVLNQTLPIESLFAIFGRASGQKIVKISDSDSVWGMGLPDQVTCWCSHFRSS